MKRAMSKLLIIVGLTMSAFWSSGASASCTPIYGPYTLSNGYKYYYHGCASSFIATADVAGGISKVIKLCDGNNPDSCTYVENTIELNLENLNGGPNALVVCKVPGAKTCTDLSCGNSPNSSGQVFVSQIFEQSQTDTLLSSDCDRKADKEGNIKCSKSAHFRGLEGDPAASALYCQNRNWVIGKWLPLNLTATAKWKGPTSPNDPTIFENTLTFKCYLQDPQGRFPWDPGYQLSNTISENLYFCEFLGQV